ncbi:aquaporin-like protein [Lanmaoa asiatica]|nr:aquaporin-like protein [Lanmaoa asiatica]
MSYPTVRLRDVAPRPRYMASWDRVKHTKLHLFTEMVAEMLGVFLYVYAGWPSSNVLVVYDVDSDHDVLALFTVGVAYSIGIVLAITVCAATSGGHFSPSVTVSFVVLRGFPVRKAVMYILAQISGAYLACLCIYVQWKDLITVVEGVLVEKRVYDALMFTPDGPAGIFALYVLPGTNLHRVLLNEFMTVRVSCFPPAARLTLYAKDLVLGLSISACLDPTNHMIPPAAAPWVVGFTYGIAIWGYSPTAIAANTARDVGGRMMAMTIWGRQATGGLYAAIAALTNIPATVLAFFVYDTLLGSCSRTLTPQHAAFLRAHKMYHEDNGLVPSGYLSALDSHNGSFDEKPVVNTEAEVDARNVYLTV